MTVRRTIALNQPADARARRAFLSTLTLMRAVADNAFGNWGQEHIAIAIPKDREKGMEYVRHFVDTV